MYRLVLATNDEQKQYEENTTSSGLPSELAYLRKDPLAIQSRGKKRGFDHVHLSIPNTNPKLVQWYGRSANGCHYPIGPVMRMVDVTE